MRVQHWTWILVAASVALSARASNALPIRFTEDFSTSAYRDADLTTADWDAAAGTLHLPLFAPSDAGVGDTPGSARNVATHGRYAYVADYDQGITVFDIIDPAQAVLIGSWDTPGYAIGLAIVGNRLFVADGSEGIRIVDITDPALPVVGGGVATNGYTNDLSAEGDLLCVADGAAGFKLFDIADPDAPTLLGSLDTPGYAYAVALSDRYAYVADGAEGLHVLDIGVPSIPAPVGTWDSPGTAYDVAVAGRTALLVDHGRGLHLVDVRDPAVPVLLGSRDTPGQARGVAVDGDVAYVADGPAGLQVISITDPTNPLLLTGRDTPDFAYAVEPRGEHAWVADGASGLRGIRVRLQHPPMAAPVQSNTWEPSYAMSAQGGWLFAGSWQGIIVYDITDPLRPAQVGQVENQVGYPAPAFGLAVRGGLLCAAQDTEGLMLVDVSNPRAPAFLGAVDTPHDPRDVALAGEVALVAAGSGGIQVIDISTPTAPQLIRTLPTPGYAYGLDVDGDLLVATTASGLFLFDISDPSLPTPTASLSTGPCIDVALADGYAYLAGGYTYSMMVVDVHDPATPVVVTSLSAPLLGRVSVSGGYAVFTGGVGHTMQVYGLADPVNPVLLDSRSVSSQPWGVAVYGDRILVGEDNESPYELFELAQRSFDTSRNFAASLPYDFQIDSVVRARLVAAPALPITWELSLDGGQNLWPVQPGQWVDFGWSETAQFVFTAQLHYADLGDFPVCPEVTVDWRYVHPVLTAVDDVPGDQGGQVRLQWVRSGHDDPDADAPIVGYSVYRRYPGTDGARTMPQGTADSGLLDKAWPPGQWDYLLTVPADGEDNYSVVVPTLADSTASGAARAVFFIRARTETIGAYFDAPADSGCSVDNLAPGALEMFTVAYGVSGNFLSWAPVAAGEVDHYRVYRGDTVGFVADAAHRVAEPVIPSWIDHPLDPWTYSYRVSAVDRAGNEGPAVAPAELTGVGEGSSEAGGPQALKLRGAGPNPFNPATTLHFDVPRGVGEVQLEIFDVRGRSVRVLMRGQLSAGTHSATWDGRDDAGRPMPSGVYLARLRAPGVDLPTIKLNLAR